MLQVLFDFDLAVLFKYEKNKERRILTPSPLPYFIYI